MPGGSDGLVSMARAFQALLGVRIRDPLVQQRRPAMVPRQVWVPGTDGEAGGFRMSMTRWSAGFCAVNKSKWP